MDDRRFAVLHALVLRPVAETGAIADVTGLDPAAAETVLTAAADAGDARALGDRWALTPSGRAQLEAAYPERFAAARASPEVARHMDRFEVLNAELLGVLTRWQTSEVGGQSVPNDHADPDYDARVLDLLGSVHDRLEPLVAALDPELPGLDRSLARLERALARADLGEHEYVSSTAVDSYHAVWHEMHETMLRSLGRDREE